MSARFVHLHLHSEYSLADSTIRIPELVARSVAQEQPAVAVTDLNNLFALVKFYRAAEQAGIKPIVGADLLLAEAEEAPSRLTLLCRDHDGYLNLSRLLTRMWMHGQRHDGVVLRPDWLRECNDGLFALAGRHSGAGLLAATGKHEAAQQWLADWQGHFDERLHLELTRTSRDGEQAFNAFALQAATQRGIPVIASNDVRFLDGDGFDAHEARVCIAAGRVLDDPRRPRDYSAEQFLKSSPAMAELFADVPDAIDNTLALATRCNLELSLGKYHLPAFPVPSDETLDSWIRVRAREGLAKRLDRHPPPAEHGRSPYEARLEKELDVIGAMGFPGYFLIVADFINWAKSRDIPVGPGRGSGAGSLVAWALGITDLDPLPYDLLFERFLNPERVSMPDFDIDFCMDRRDEVIDYVADKYGRDRVSQIITYGTMAAKAVVRDCGRVLGYPYGFVDGIAKLIPLTLGISLSDALGRSEKSRANADLVSSELVQRYRDEDDVRDLIDLALQLENLTRNAGKHAGGVVIAPSPLSDFCPLFAEHDGEGGGRHPVTQFDKDDVETIGLVKFDFLGLRTLTIIDWAVKAINKGSAATPPSPPGRGRSGEAASGEGSGHADVRNDNVISRSRELPNDDANASPHSPAGPSSGASRHLAPRPGPAQRAGRSDVREPVARKQHALTPEGEGSAPLDISAIPLDDKATYELFARGDTVAVFQFESRGMRELLKRAQPDTFEDLIALAALFRPGPLGSGMDREWVERKHGRTEVSFPHPALEPVLKPTYGVIVYQEQVMQIAQVLAGYSLGGADLLRRAMGKKKAAEMARERTRFEEGAAKRGVEPRRATQIFDLMEKFAEYGFNKSHSAAYALVAYQTAWLKVHYPAQFMAAVLSSDMDNTDKVVAFLAEARVMRLEVLAPDVNASKYMFEALQSSDSPIHGTNRTSRARHMSAPAPDAVSSDTARPAHPCAGTIRYGLGAIKGVGRGLCEAIVAERVQGGHFVDLLDFCRRVDSGKLNKRALEALVQAGALDALGSNRASLLLQLPEVLKATEQLTRERDAGQSSLFGGGLSGGTSDDAATDLQIELPKTDDWSLARKLQGERETLGHYLSGHPLDPCRDELRGLVGHHLGELARLCNAKLPEEGRGWRQETTVVVAGLVASLRKRGDTQAFVQLEDGHGRLECAFFSEAYNEYAPLLTRDRILLVEGGLREDEFSGGYSLRVRRCWDYQQLCTQHAQRLSVRMDLRQDDTLARFERALHDYTPGSTPLLLEAITPGAVGRLTVNGGQGVRMDAALPGLLRGTAGIRKVKVTFARPWLDPATSSG